MPKPENRRLGGHEIHPQLHPTEAPHRLAFVNRIIRRRIGEIELLLQEVDAKHLLEPQGLTATPSGRIMRRDERE